MSCSEWIIAYNYKISYAAGTLTVKPKPTAKPTAKPTGKPTAKPTAKPTVKPTLKPTPKPAKPDYTALARMYPSGASKTALRIRWTKVDGANGYDVFFARCGGGYKVIECISGTSLKVSGLKKNTAYKAYVRAWKRVNGRKKYIGAATPVVHAISGGYDGKYCNAKSVKLNRSSVSLKQGKSYALKATVKGVKSGRKLLQHARKVRYYSSDVNVATVSASGRVKAVGKGRCTVWAIANNGERDSMKIVVK